MNKIYNISIAIMMFLSHSAFAAENIDIEKYRSVVKAYNEGYLKDIVTEADLRIVQAHKHILEKRKETIESSYIPLLLNVIAGSLVAFSIGMFGYALSGATAAHTLLSESGPHLSYFDHLKYLAGIDKGWVFWAKGKYTEKLLQVSSQNEQDVVAAGVAALPLALGSLVTGTLSLYLFKKAVSYKDEVAQINQGIEKDNAILKLFISEALIK